MFAFASGLPLVLLHACEPDVGTVKNDGEPATDTGSAGDSGDPGDSTPAGDSSPADTEDTTPPADSSPPADPELSDFDLCFADIADTGAGPSPDYDQYGPTIGTHCNGTNQQEITGIERVVFLGDSVTVGTPPHDPYDFYRTLLAMELADRFGLQEPDWFWMMYDVFSGGSMSQESGDFASCAEWGARTDDLMRDGDQVLACLPEEERVKNTLVVMTIGGNDLNAITDGFLNGTPTEELWEETYDFVALLRDTVDWLKSDPALFPSGLSIVFSNNYEFTDATGDVTACPTAGLAGYDAAITDPELAKMVVWAMEQYMSIAVDYDVDMIFMLENFCGHGFNHDDESGRCYRGADAKLWFDFTCIHPNDTGAVQIAEMFMDVVEE